ncbi:hypothetical protein CYLTODRAFT_152907 [Cylindrobasidium torrendii FP15055 ss-10]|uniref:Virilizer N-terminal domain-containing protein n=1 Tax=Cylindrobasidium torrendii FP15055 ss-10 TaxID=1314674 RepID=A0A0D7BUK7_9AGAR|nr:hypothetical protein CYLTODRAFT_152907 [Cylindrobasidium torrendii FP15055 ss-10]
MMVGEQEEVIEAALTERPLVRAVINDQTHTMSPALLYYGTVSPAPGSGTAACRFLRPLCISSIRIFAAGSRPFAQSPDLLAETAPDAFFLNLYFNQAGANVDKDRRNVLAPTSLGYTGADLDFALAMPSDAATRLMIISGSFTKLSFALYGQVVAPEPPIAVSAYHPLSIPSAPRSLLPPSIHVAALSDPTTLAASLLKLVPDYEPDLPQVTRLMFCLKPNNDEWASSDFPYHGSPLDIPDNFDLELASDMASRLVNASKESMTIFAQRIKEALGPKNTNQAFHVARTFCGSASQDPSLMRSLCSNIDLDVVFDIETLDDDILTHLLDAASNADFAKHCRASSIPAVMKRYVEYPTTPPAGRRLARRLLDRLEGWPIFELSLSQPSSDPSTFARPLAFLNDFAREEKCLGIWLESMMLEPGLVDMLAQKPPADSAILPVANPQTRSEFETYLRAFLGVAAVFVVWAWSDSLPEPVCRDRCLGIIKLWQMTDGYRDIVNQYLLLRQFSRRLMWIIARDPDEPPKISPHLSEQILSELGKIPEAFLHKELCEAVFDLHLPLSYISDGERARLQKLASLADYGLADVVDELFYQSEAQTFSTRRLYVLRVAIAWVKHEVQEEEDGEYRVGTEAWNGFNMALWARLLDLLTQAAGNLAAIFSLAASPPQRIETELVEMLFKTARDILVLVMLLTAQLQFSPRTIREFTVTIASLFASAQTATAVFSLCTEISDGAQEARKAGMEFLSNMAKTSPLPVLSALLEPVIPMGVDPVVHIHQCAVMVHDILALSSDSSPAWVQINLPPLLNLLDGFSRRLDAESRRAFLKHIVDLDSGCIGVGEWLLTHELKHLRQILTRETTPAHLSLAHTSLCALARFAQDKLEWFATANREISDFHGALKDALEAMLDGGYVSQGWKSLVRTLGDSHHDWQDAGQCLAMSYIRSLRVDRAVDADVNAVVKQLENGGLHIRAEVGQWLSDLSAEKEPSQGAMVVAAKTMHWLSRQEHSLFRALPSFDNAGIGALLRLLASVEGGDALSTAGFVADEDESLLPPLVNLDAPAQVTLSSIEDLFNASHKSVPPTPSTPKGKGTVTPDVLGVVMSPPTALFHSPMSSTLTKTYANNEFRDTRQQATRQNTSRLPSMHVDVGSFGH